MKKLLITLIALVGISIAVNAQTPPSGVRPHVQNERRREAMRHHRHRKIRRMHRHHRRTAQQLNLSTEQKSLAKSYHQEFKQKMLALNSNENITVKEQRDRKAALLKEQKSKMQSLLTPDQKNKMAQLKAEDKAKAEQHYAARMEKMKATLNLTDKQVAAMKAQRTDMMAKLKAIKEDDRMDRVAKKEKLMTLKTEMKEENKKIYTPEQLQKIEELKKARMDKKAVK